MWIQRMPLLTPGRCPCWFVFCRRCSCSTRRRRRRSSAAVHGALFFFATVLVAVVAAVFFPFSLVTVATLFLFFLEELATVAFEDVIVVAVGLPAGAVAAVAAAVALTSVAISAPGSKRTGSLREREVDRLLTMVMVLDNMVED